MGKEKLKKNPDRMVGGMESNKILMGIVQFGTQGWETLVHKILCFARESKHLVGENQEDLMASCPARC